MNREQRKKRLEKNQHEVEMRMGNDPKNKQPK